jgi:thiamine pyrophosphate-dependent acetolactate synthase large subunit-like protein
MAALHHLPCEITALSMADGYARISGKPQAVVVHADVGTQALGQAVHNASVARVSVSFSRAFAHILKLRS